MPPRFRRENAFRVCGLPRQAQCMTGHEKQTAPFSGAVCSQFGYVGAVYAAAIAGALFPDAVGAVRRAGFDAVAASLFSASLSMASAFLTMRLR